MLQIQRASAGSGKTYTLAKNFILHLIGDKNKKGEWRLRSKKEIEEYTGKILAITFTNKATAEMKERIITKLSSLGALKNGNIIEKGKQPDYLEDFIKIFHSDEFSIGEKCDFALKSLLNNYSNFHISTIDSFFQEILRTFAYEADLNDNFQLEIDSDFVYTSALDTTLNDFDRKDVSNEEIKFWLNILMRQEALKSQRWNVFAKGKKSIYGKVKQALKQLDSEDYKNIKTELDDYFSSPDVSKSLKTYYQRLKEEGVNERIEGLATLKKMALDLLSEINEPEFPEKELNRFFTGHLTKTASLEIDDKLPFQYSSIKDSGSVFKKNFNNTSFTDFNVRAMAFYQKLSDWEKPDKYPAYTAWRVYGELLPYFGLILEVNKRLSEILVENNTIKLSDTSSLLKRIIGNDDVPFVFERLGTYIDTYLIDEFQDTSQMQWDVMKPLLTEGESNGNDSLIIGDPKQSIYRFRNANHRLIMKDVPETFPLHKAAGLSKEENTNHRSQKLIVEFNNFLFKSLSEFMTELSRKKGNSYRFDDLYCNVVQYPKSQEEKGYIRIQFINKDDNSGNGYQNQETVSDDDSGWNDYEARVLPLLGPQISEILSRGYRQKDIGILVSTNNHGKKVIDALMRYNELLPAGTEKIRFISEESLILESSPAVNLIIQVMRRIANGPSSPIETEDKPEHKSSQIKWENVKADYEFFALAHPELKGQELIMAFVERKENNKIITDLLKNLETPTLVAITEVIVEKLMSDEMRKTEGLYLAAFQDALHEYSSSFSNDAASFLEWWETKGRRLSVSSPSGIDAVEVMTIHKSKGLEFKCVLLPFASDNVMPSPLKSEWRWVRPMSAISASEQPPFLPVVTSRSLEGTVHQDLYREYVDQVMTDTLNMYYVAFTRARNELYVYCKKPETSSTSMNTLLFTILNKPNELNVNSKEEAKWILDTDKITKEADSDIITIGKQGIEKTRESQNIETHIFENYFVRKNIPKLKFRISDKSDFED